MPISVITNTFPKRDPSLAWEDLGPGLYENEIAVELSTGEKVAVSVDVLWLPNGAGLSLTGNARWIDATGQTNLDPAGEHAEANIQVTASMNDVQEFTVQKLAKDVGILLIGEGPRLMRPADPVNDVPARCVFDLDKNTEASVSIKSNLEVIKAAKTFKFSVN